MTKAEKFGKMTKAQLTAVAKEEYGLTFNSKMLKGDMIEDLLNAKKPAPKKSTSSYAREPLKRG